MKLKINVTKEVLRKSMWCKTDKMVPLYPGHKGSTTNCAITYALHEVFPCVITTHQSVWFYGTLEDISKDVSIGRAVLPSIATNFIDKFDSLVHRPEKRLELPEISFEIDVHESVIDSIGINEVKELISKSKTLEIV